ATCSWRRAVRHGREHDRGNGRIPEGTDVPACSTRPGGACSIKTTRIHYTPGPEKTGKSMARRAFVPRARVSLRPAARRSCIEDAFPWHEKDAHGNDLRDPRDLRR